MVETAKRECEEEIGIKQEAIQIIGVLSSLYIPPSNFHVTPAVGILNHPFEMNVSPYEVQEVIKMPLQTLLMMPKRNEGDYHFIKHSIRIACILVK
ncbi:MAG: NUDIX domain-containing protein [Bacteroidetes bacterium]|nr:NUDIX domain-containing protein [Bacteroidota bacterium]